MIMQHNRVQITDDKLGMSFQKAMYSNRKGHGESLGLTMLSFLECSTGYVDMFM
jgi:hypothetical protein